MRQKFTILTLCLCSHWMMAQSLKNIDWVYQENIKTVRILPERVSQTFANFDKKSKTLQIQSSTELEVLPVIGFGETGYLSFDDMDGDFKFYRYRIEQCNADWSPTQLSEQEYIDGFSEYRLSEGHLSFGNTTNYTHYDLAIPNANTKITKSGNYLVHIFLDNDAKTPILTRRFLMVEQLTSINPHFVPTGKADKTYTHHELDFEVTYDKYKINNAKREIKAVVLQNGRWDNAKKNIPPTYERTNELLFDYQDSIVFPAGREFRIVDIRSLMSRGFHIRKLSSTKTSYDVTVEKDVSRSGGSFLFAFDNNGAYVIGSRDALQGTFDPSLQCEYANVLFTLDLKEELDNKDIYIVGKFSDWQLHEENKMFYDQVSNTYLAELRLKQGFYDYAYAAVKKGSKEIDLGEIDTDQYQTENAYSIIIYHRAIGSRYDRIIGYRTIDSAPGRF